MPAPHEADLVRGLACHARMHLPKHRQAPTHCGHTRFGILKVIGQDFGWPCFAAHGVFQRKAVDWSAVVVFLDAFLVGWSRRAQIASRLPIVMPVK